MPSNSPEIKNPNQLLTSLCSQIESYIEKEGKRDDESHEQLLQAISSGTEQLKEQLKALPKERKITVEDSMSKRIIQAVTSLNLKVPNDSVQKLIAALLSSIFNSKVDLIPDAEERVKQTADQRKRKVTKAENDSQS